MAMAKADLVVVTDAPPKSMNPHAFLRTPTSLTCPTFLTACCSARPGRQAVTGPGREMGTAGCPDLEVRAAQGRQISQRQCLYRRRRQVHLRAHEGPPVLQAAQHRQFHRLHRNAGRLHGDFQERQTGALVCRNHAPEFHRGHGILQGRDDGDYNTRPIGTGAYKLVEWVKGSYVRMAANPTTGKAQAQYKRWTSDPSPKRPPALPPWPANRPTSSTAYPYP
jgi:hypothetical protein